MARNNSDNNKYCPPSYLIPRSSALMVWPNFLILVCVYVFFFFFFFNTLFQCTDQVLFLASLTFPAGFFFFLNL